MRLRRPDPALAALLAAVALLGCASAVATPVEAPHRLGIDEAGHLAYVQALAEHGRAPEEDRPGFHADAFSTEQWTARRGSGVAAPAGRESLERRPRPGPAWTAATERRWRAADGALGPGARRDGGGPNAFGYMPPGYYALLVAPYEVVGGSWFDRALAMRLVNTLLVVLAAALAWRLALAVGLPRAGALACAGVVGLNPHAIELAGVVNPDAAVLALWTGALLAGVRLLRAERVGVPLAALVLLAAALLAVKPIGLALLPAAALAIGVALRRRRRAGAATSRWGAAAWLGSAAVAVGVLAVVTTRRLERPLVDGGERLGELPGYLAQFYTPLAAPFDSETGWVITNLVAVERSVAASLGPAVLALLALAAAVWLRPRRPGAVLAFLALASLGLLAGVHWSDFKALTEGRGPFVQSRYLLPLTPVAGLLLGAAAARIPARWTTAALALCAGSAAAWVLERSELAYA